MPPKATASKPVDSPKPGLLIKRPLVNRPLGSAGRGAERLSIAEPAAKAKSPRAADNATVAALRNGAAAAALLARKTPPTARPVDASLKDPKTRGVPRGLVGAADDARADDDVTRMASLARLVNNLPDAASAVEEARQQHGTPLGAWSGDLLVAERPSRSDSVENFLRASEQVEANLERLQEALTRASSQDEEFLSQLVGRVDSAIARNPMAPSTPRTPAAGEKHFFGGGGDNEPEESEEQKKLFEEMKAQDFAEANDENEARVVPTSAPGNPTANPAATVAAVAAAGEEAAQLREANALLAAQVAELADALARADERAAWAVQKTETQKQQLLEVRRSTPLEKEGIYIIYIFKKHWRSKSYLDAPRPFFPLLHSKDPLVVHLGINP